MMGETPDHKASERLVLLFSSRPPSALRVNGLRLVLLTHRRPAAETCQLLTFIQYITVVPPQPGESQSIPPASLEPSSMAFNNHTALSENSSLSWHGSFHQGEINSIYKALQKSSSIQKEVRDVASGCAQVSLTEQLSSSTRSCCTVKVCTIMSVWCLWHLLKIEGECYLYCVLLVFG